MKMTLNLLETALKVIAEPKSIFDTIWAFH